MNLFITEDDTLNRSFMMGSYLQKTTIQAKIEAKLIKAMNIIHTAKDLTDTKRELIVLKAKIQAGSTQI